MLIAALIGGALGYFYYAFVGCGTGTCAITSSPIKSTLYFMFMGGLFGSMISKD